jgi:hypothetical protein
VDALFERVAGLDVGKESVTVGLHGKTRTFMSTFVSLRVMRD